MNKKIHENQVDANDLDIYGMDARTQKRLRVKKPLIKKVRKPQKALRTNMPFHLKTESKLRVRGWESKSVTPEAHVFNLFFKSVPLLNRYLVGKIERRKNGLLAQGRIKGRRVIDYELDVWVESKRSGGDIIVKFNLFPMTGNPLGETYRVSIMRAEKVAPKFAMKFNEFLSKLRRK